MGDSPSSRLRIAALAAAIVSGALLGAVILTTGAAHADEVGPPIKLGPPDATKPPADSNDDAQPADSGSGDDSRPHAPHGISADALPPPSPDSAGALGPQDRSLPQTLWQGTSGSTALTLLPHIGSSNSPSVQDLAFRLLASPATPPAGDQPLGALLALRAERLANGLGRTDAALALLQGAPPQQQSEALGQITVDLAFLAGDVQSACTLVRGRDKGWQETYWDQGMVTCQALNGQDADARLGLDVLREAKFKDDGFSALVEASLGGGKPPDTLPSPQPMALALLGKSGAGVPKRVFDGASLAILRTIALNQGFPADQRLIAAEKAASLGALPAAKLAEAYVALPLDPGEKEQPLTLADKAQGSRARAILYQAALAAPLATAKANFLATLFAKAQKSDVYFAVIRAAEPLLLAVPASQDLSGAAPDFARALYALDRPGDAAAWLAVAGANDQAALMPLAHIVDDRTAPAWGKEGLTDLLSHASRDGGLVQRRAVLAAELLAAEGTPPPDAMLLPLLDAKVGVTPNVMPELLISSEAAGRRLGGTVLAVLSALGDQGAASPGNLVATSVRALHAVGLGNEARHLAIDAAIASGL